MESVLTTAAVAREAGISERRVRIYADAGIVQSTRDSAGRRIFPSTAPEQARAAFEQRTRHIRRA